MTKFTVRIRKHERGLRFKHGDFIRLVDPGTYRLWSRLWNSKRDCIDVVNTLNTKFEHPMLQAILASNSAELRDQLEIIDLSDAQRALIWVDGRLAHIVGPGRHAFWKSPYKVEVEIFDITSLRFQHAKLEAIIRHPESGQHLDVIEVDPHADALMIVNGELKDRLTAGKFAFWKNAARLRVVPVDRREQTADVAGQEIMTADKVTLRVNLLVTYQVADAVKAVTTVSDYSQSLYREAQLVLRAAVGAKAIDALLADKESIGSEVQQALTARVAEFGQGDMLDHLRGLIRQNGEQVSPQDN